MSDEELWGKHTGLRAELSAAYTSWNTTHINRITSELAAIERRLASREVTQRWPIVRPQPAA